MADTASSLLNAWSNFFVMTGTAAAALTGLTFIVITLVTGEQRMEVRREGIATFSTPLVMHFAAALLVSAVFVAPWSSLAHAGVAAALIGLGGVAYILRVMHRTLRFTDYTADLEDWIWFSILPFVAYGAISTGAIVLDATPVRALFILGGGVLLLIFIGIRNAWDIVTYMAIKRS